MFRSSIVGKSPFASWRRNRAAKKQNRRPNQRAAFRYRFAFERWEDRLAPATFAEAAGVITVTLTSNNETIKIFSKGPNLYNLTPPDTTNGFITAGLVPPSSFSTPTGS